MVVAEYIRKLQSYEEYAFSWEELLSECHAPESTIRKELVRLARRNEIVNIRKGFFLIISAKYQNFGKIPVQLYVEKLFNTLNKDYYLGLFTAASFHGAAHQQVQEDFVFSPPPSLRDVIKGKFNLRFLVSRNWPRKNVIRLKADSGYFNVSSPALTMVDLIQHQSKFGGVNRILANLQELSEILSREDLSDLLEWYPHKSNLQRLGFLLEYLDVNEDLVKTLIANLAHEPIYPVLLNGQSDKKLDFPNNRWKVDVNVNLEADL